MRMFAVMEYCIHLINNNVGHTVVGWYKRDVINNKSIISARNINCDGSNRGNTNSNNTEEDVQVDSVGISYHIVSISPSNHTFLDTTNKYVI